MTFVICLSGVAKSEDSIRRIAVVISCWVLVESKVLDKRNGVFVKSLMVVIEKIVVPALAKG
jgi:hypothetical protein